MENKGVSLELLSTLWFQKEPKEKYIINNNKLDNIGLDTIFRKFWRTLDTDQNFRKSLEFRRVKFW